MQLLDLPSEILAIILNFVGPDHFRKHAGCLAISKSWYRFARPVLLSSIHLSTATLRAGLLRSLKDPGTLAATQRYTSTVSICLDPPSPEESDDGQHVWGLPHPGFGLSQVAIDIVQLGRVLRRLRQLRSLRIYPGKEELRVESSALKTLVSLQRGLTSLDIDLANVDYMDEEHVQRPRICESISDLMPSLVSLRCRLPYLCEEILEPLPENGRPVPHGVGGVDEDSLQRPLKELIVNTSISEWSPSITGYRFSKHCSRASEPLYPVDGPSPSRLQSRMSSLTSQYPNLKVVRLISHQLPSLDWYALDALSGKKLWLPPGCSWDADGELFDEIDEIDEVDEQDGSDSGTDE